MRGVPTTHYFAAVDWKKALARAATESGQQGFLAQLENMPSAVASIPVDVWVDADNLVRRMRMNFSFAGPGEPEPGQGLDRDGALRLRQVGKRRGAASSGRRRRLSRFQARRTSATGRIRAWLAPYPNASRRGSDSRDLIPPGGDVTCLVSGGADSTCLWHVLTRARVWRVARSTSLTIFVVRNPRRTPGSATSSWELRSSQGSGCTAGDGGRPA